MYIDINISFNSEIIWIDYFVVIAFIIELYPNNSNSNGREKIWNNASNIFYIIPMINIIFIPYLKKWE